MNTNNSTAAENEILPSFPRFTPLYDLDNEQIETLEAWYRELHNLVDCDSLKSILGNGHMWSMTLGEWIAQEQAFAAAE